MSEVTVQEAGPRGMITIRGDWSDGALTEAVATAVGTAFPAIGRVETKGARALAWMSPDEALLMLPVAEAGAALEAVQAALGGNHALAVDVSDARVVFRVEGPGWRDALARLTPADLRPDGFGPGIFRRTRLAQAAAAFWLPEPQVAEVLCFRSVGAYVRDLLENAATFPSAGLHPTD